MEHSIQDDQDINILDEKFILKPSDNYRGLSYGELVIRWHSWLMSDDPEKYNSGDVYFLRGNIGYHEQPDTFFFRKNIKIHEGTAILVPVVTTLYAYGDYYDGKLINDEFLLRRAIQEHVDAAGPFWATIEQVDSPIVSLKRIVSDLGLYRFESPLFQLNTSDRNPFLNSMDEPNLPGIRTALGAGYFVLLQNLDPSKYRIRFGGKGMSDFFTDAIYEITIISKDKIQKDISGHSKSPNELLEGKKSAISDTN